jgi:peptide/nickel transport system substrate-binding protein
MARRGLFAALVFAMTMTACPGNKAGSETGPSRGGTLRVVAPASIFDSLDPQLAYDAESWEFMRCCLARTLFAFRGSDADNGGSLPALDLASSRALSADSLTWTIRIRRGIRYSPPLATIVVGSQDFVRALNREARLHGPYAFYYSVIRGFDDYASGKADTISGLETPDARTLIVRLTQPTGDLDSRLALPATAPIPAQAGHPEAPFGIATGHDKDYGRLLVGTGPYMIDGTASLNFTGSGGPQAVSGFVPHAKLSLVRNPSWRGSIDRLRGAYVDRIEGTIGPVRPDPARMKQSVSSLESGQQDVFFGVPPPQEAVERYRQTASLRARLKETGGAVVFYITMNLAMPPFDDVHVRRAVAFAIDREELFRRTFTSPTTPFSGTADVAGHFVPDGMLGDVLLDFSPYPRRGSPSAAQDEMRRSRYDRNHDGTCDAPACSRVHALQTVPDPTRRADVVVRSLKEVGLSLTLERVSLDGFYKNVADPTKHVALGWDWGWQADYPNPGTFFVPQFNAGSIGSSNPSLIGASSAQLASAGYAVRTVPAVEDRISQCQLLLGAEQARCWARFDKYMTEELVPFVPYLTTQASALTSDRVEAFSFSQFTTMPALDQISLKTGGA